DRALPDGLRPRDGACRLSIRARHEEAVGVSERRDPESPGQAGREGYDEPSEGTLAPSPELEQAMREAAESVEAIQQEHRHASGAPEGDPPQPEAAADEEVEAVRAELAETRDRLLRLAADFDNFRKRALKEREEAHHFGHQ